MPYQKLTIHTDGGARGNPGPAAAAYVITDGEMVLETDGKYLGEATNNQAEYQAVRLALEAASKFKPRALVFSLDSELVVRQLNGLYKIKNAELKPIYDAIKGLVKNYEAVTFSHVRREYNQLADAEVNRILDQEVQRH